MKHEQLYELLKQMKLPLAYSHFSKAQNPPYLVYFTEDSNTFAADNRVYFKEANWVIELYTDKKDLNLETRLEVLLEDAELYYEKYEAYIDTEKMYQIRYEL